MKTTLWLLLAASLLSLGGCAMNEADREFYGRHWMHPTELDNEGAAPPPSTNGMPNNPAIEY